MIVGLLSCVLDEEEEDDVVAVLEVGTRSFSFLGFRGSNTSTIIWLLALVGDMDGEEEAGDCPPPPPVDVNEVAESLFLER